MRLALLTIWLAFVTQGVSQADTSLTREFANLSAKERARIAKKEQDDAAKDVVFQAVMADAERSFQGQQYRQALAQYTEARRLRPLNVYPKVKIQDLTALIAKQEEAAKVSDPGPPPEVVQLVVDVQSTAEVDSVVPFPHQSEIPPPLKEAPIPKRDTTRADSKPIPRIKEPTAPSEGQAPLPPMPDGVTERSYLEGRAVVLERCLVANGRKEVFRRVSHPWGQVVHFRDGQAISEREWNAVFDGP